MSTWNGEYQELAKEEEKRLHHVLQLYEGGEEISKDGSKKLRKAIDERDNMAMRSILYGDYGFKDVESPLAKFVARRYIIGQVLYLADDPETPPAVKLDCLRFLHDYYGNPQDDDLQNLAQHRENILSQSTE